MTSWFMAEILIIGWVSYFLAILANCAYYAIHPSAPKLSPTEKLKTHLLGHIYPNRSSGPIEDKEIELGKISKEGEAKPFYN